MKKKDSIKNAFIRKRFLCLMLLGIFSKGYGQTADSYGFASASGTYSAITGGTLLSSGASMDDAEFSVSIPSFTYLGTAYTQVYVSENGYIQFGAVAPSDRNNYISSTSANSTQGLAAYSRDLEGTAGAELRTEVVGSEIIFQWTNMRNYSGTQVYTFQIRLNTTTNEIRFVYNTMTSTSITTAEVGLRGVIPDYKNRTTTTSWTSSLAGTTSFSTMELSATVFPPSGLNYIWTPPPPCSAKPVGGTISSSVGGALLCPSTFATLSVAGATITTGITYAWDSSTVSATGPWSAISGATATTYDASPAACTNAYYRRRTICAGVGLFDSSNSVMVSVRCALTPPYFEDFESITVVNAFPNCMTTSGTLVTSYLAATTYNRSNHTPGGSKYAAFRYDSDDYLYTPAIITTAGLTYEFSFWYITDGLVGWDSLQVKSGVAPTATAMTTTLGTALTALTNTSYKKYTVRFVATTSGIQYFGIHCRSSSVVPWHLSIDDIGLQELRPCSGVPAPGAPVASASRVCGSASVDLDLPALVPTLGYTFRWQDSVSGGTWGDDPGRPSHMGFTVPFTTGIFATTTYFRCIVKCTLTGDSAVSSVLKVDGGPLEPPYFENFESITRENQLPQCMTTTNLSDLTLSYIAPNSRNRSNHTLGGGKYAAFRYGCDDYIFSPELNLVAGQQYIFSFWYITDGLGGWNTLNAGIGTTPTAAGMTRTLKTIRNPRNTVYAQYLDTFTATTSGIYHFGIYCQSSFAPWYLSIDDIGLQFRPCSGMPTAGAILGTVPSGTGVCANSFVSLKGIGSTLYSIPGILYQWQRKSMPFGTTWQNVVGANDSVYAADTLGGYEYRLAVICSNTNDSAFSLSYTLPLLPAHPPVSISPSLSPTTFCAGDTVKFTATNVIGSIYDWTVDGVVIPGWKFNDLSTTSAGTYIVKVSSPSAPCPAYSKSVVLIQNDPGYGITMGTPSDSIVCEGTSLLLSGFGSKGGLTYQWYRNNVIIPGATSNTYLVSTSGAYRISAFDGISYCRASSRSISIVVNKNPPAALSVPSGTTTACEHEGLLLKANTGFYSYEWSKGGSTIFGWTDSTQLIKTSGVYRVKIRDANGCVSVSLPLRVNILPAPTPTISRSGLILSATSGVYVSYRWVRNGIEIASIAPSFSVTKKGVYKLIVTDANGCEGESAPIEMSDAGLSISNVNVDEQIVIYPNPTTAKVFIESPIDLDIAVNDISGKTIIPARQTKEIDLSKFADGIYMLIISDNGKLLKQQKITKMSQR